MITLSGLVAGITVGLILGLIILTVMRPAPSPFYGEHVDTDPERRQ